jgi:hypothetical protein
MTYRLDTGARESWGASSSDIMASVVITVSTMMKITVQHLIEQPPIIHAPRERVARVANLTIG